MKHYGDITKLSGYNLPVVDIVTGGSPCQDLSVAGKRAGLQGARSGLFMEQIRIIKELREHDKSNRGSNEFIRPRYMVWENVPGAFNSNKGEDFRCVLEETARVVCENAVIPQPPKGKWSYSGCILGDGWSIAWRVHDAQFWGVPQRRKRIALVADFGGQTAPEILFERKGLSGDIEQSEEAGQNITEAAGRSSDSAISFQERAGCAGGGKGILIQHGRTGALSTLGNQSVFKFPDSEDTDSTICIEGNGTRGSHKGNGYKESDTMYTLNTVEQHAVVSYKKDEIQKQTPETMCVVQDAYDKLTESQISASIKASGGNYGGGAKL